MDDLDRLIQAEQGTWGGSSISSGTHDQTWTLDHLGNWDHVTLDLEGDGNFTGTDEYNDDRSHNEVNELTGRDTNDDGTNEDDLVYDAVGNLTDDDADYQYVYDPFGRLRKIKNQSGTLLAEYLHNGLGHMIGRHEDTDDDGDADSSDKWYYSVFDEAWRLVGTYREDDSSPKEDFLNHVAGHDGNGAASYINGVILRDKDANSDWTGTADGTLEERIYYCQNWRGDVVALVDKDSEQVEAVRYTAYGEPFGIPAGDTNSDGDRDGEDAAQFTTWVNSSAYDVRGDWDLDGDVDAIDKSAAISAGASTLGGGEFSALRNRLAYAGGSHLASGLYSLRRRVLSPGLGRFLPRDPSGHSDGPNLYAYSRTNPILRVDSSGLTSVVRGSFSFGGFVASSITKFAEGHYTTYWRRRRICEDAKAEWLKDNPGGTIFGATVCDNGTGFICVYADWKGTRAPGVGQDKAREIINGCTAVHERNHLNDAAFSCDPGETGSPGDPKEENPNWSHAPAIEDGLDCLEGYEAECAELKGAGESKDCESNVEDHIEFNCNSLRAEGGDHSACT